MQPGLPGAFLCASRFLWPFCLSCLLRVLRACVDLFLFFSCLPCLHLFCFVPRSPGASGLIVSGGFCFSAPGPIRPGALRFLVPAPPVPPRPPLFFFPPPVPCAPVVSGSGVLLFLASCVLGLGAVRFPSPPSCCLVLSCSVLHVVLWWPALCFFRLLRVVRCSLLRLLVYCAVLCCAVLYCSVLCRVFGRIVPLRCPRCGLLSRRGLRCHVLCRVPGCCAAPRGFVSCRAVLWCCTLRCFVWFFLVPLFAISCARGLSVALGCSAFQRCVFSYFSALCALGCLSFPVVCCCVLLFVAVLCALCVLGCCAVCSLPSPRCAMLCCAVLVRVRCADCLVCAVSGAW